MRLLTAAAVVTGAVSASPALADMIANVTEGQTWRIENTRGPNGRLTLNPDGTGRMRAGPISVRATWERRGSQFCLTAGPIGTRCVALTARGGGYAGAQNGETVFRMSR